MSLDNIQLPGIVIQDLFKKSLVDLKTEQVAAPSTHSSSMAWLGKNGQKVAILVHSTESLYLPDQELEFLMGILSACRLTMADVALVNLHRYPGTDYKALTSATEAEKLILFGITPDSLQMPLSFPHYQVQRYNNQIYLSAPPLSALQADRMEKSKLWTCLKQVFSI